MADFNYPRDHSRAAYNSKGQVFWCHQKDDEVRAKQEGFTSWTYIKSKWPTTVWNVKGETKAVGNVDWTDEKNDAALSDLKAKGWSTDHIPVPEPEPEVKNQPMDLAALASIMADVKLVVKRVEELEEAVVERDERIATLEAILNDAGPKKK